MYAEIYKEHGKIMDVIGCFAIAHTRRTKHTDTCDRPQAWQNGSRRLAKG